MIITLIPNYLKKIKTFQNSKKKLKGKFTIGYAGSIGLSNGLDCLIRVIKQIENPKINFVFLGDGGLRKKYQQELKGYNNAYFTGKVKREKVKYYLNLFDVLYFSALPSKVWDYGWSLNKMIDYMMAGKPVLAAYDGHKSMINEANCGFFIQSNNEDQLKLMIDDLAHRETCELSEIGKNGTKWIINNRMWDTIAENYINLF
jgi:glycosyltransferase involved in cell wall biosynthesis